MGRYNKQTWINGISPTSAERMTHIEEGIATAQNDANLANARVDSIAKLPQGSTTGDAELIDARTDIEGVTYDSLGQMTRAMQENAKKDHEKLSGDITMLEKTLDDSIKYIDNDSVTWNHATLGADGIINVSQYNILSDPIEIDRLQSISFYGKTENDNGVPYACYVGFYYGDTFIKREIIYGQSYGILEAKVPYNADHIRLMYGHASSYAEETKLGERHLFVAYAKRKSDFTEDLSNIFYFTNNNNRVSKGVEFSVNSDGTFNFVGHATDDINYSILGADNTNEVNIKAGTYFYHRDNFGSKEGAISIRYKYSIYDEEKIWSSDTAVTFESDAIVFARITKNVVVNIQSCAFGIYLGDAIPADNNITAVDSVARNQIEKLSKLTNVNPLGLHTVPESKGVENAIRRARQLTDVKWTPVIDLPRFCGFNRSEGAEAREHFEGLFKAGKEYIGVPYGRSDATSQYGYSDMCIGMFVPIDAFVTSVENPNSYLCKRSAYDEASHRATRYGCVCSQLVGYALGQTVYRSTNDIVTITGMSKIGLVNEINLNDLKLGDLLHKASVHVAIVTDIIKDDNENVICIEVSEATSAGNTNPSIADGLIGGVARRLGWTVDDNKFMDYWTGYTVYRYGNIDKVTYQKNEFVSTGSDEIKVANSLQLPVIPYMGNKFRYLKDFIYNSTLVLNTHYFGVLKVFKDGSLLNAFSITNDMDSVEVGFREKGKYTAYLCNIDENGIELMQSASCEWTVN